MRTPLLLLSVALLAAGCSSNSDGDPATENEPTGITPGPGTTTPGDDGDGAESPSDDDTGASAPGDAAADGMPTITADNYEEIVAFAFRVYNGNAFAPDVFALPGYRDGVIDRAASPDSVPLSVVCENGGTLEAVPDFIDGARVSSWSWDLDFEECQQGSLVVDGDLRRGYVDRFSVGSVDGLVLTTPDRTVSFQGGLTRSNGNTYGGEGENTLVAGVDTFVREQGEDVLRIANMRSRAGVTGSGAIAIVNGGFEVSAPESGGRTLTVEAVEELRYSVYDSTEADPVGGYAGRYQTGRLEISAEDGSRLVLEPLEGDETQASVTVSGAGVSETFVEPWSIWSEAIAVGYEVP